MEVYLAPEVNLRQFDFGETQMKNEHDYCKVIRYRGKPFRLQTDWMTVTFGLMRYENQQVGMTNYSTALTFFDGDETERMITDLETAVLEEVGEKEPNKEFYSTIRPGKNKFKPHLRVKIKNSGKTLNLTVDCGGDTIINPTDFELDSLLTHGRRARCILHLNPLWVSGSRFGISWRLVRIQLEKEMPDFREDYPIHCEMNLNDGEEQEEFKRDN